MPRRRIRLIGTGTGVDGLAWESSVLLRIGRLENLEVSINDPSISRRHAEIEWTEGGWVVRDLGSTNGTFLNAGRVGRADQRLKQRDILQCGNVILQVAALEDDGAHAHETISDSMRVEFATHHTWEQAFESCADPLAMAADVRTRMLTLLRIGREFSSVTTVDALLHSILQDAVKALQAQGGAILLLDEGEQQLALRAVKPEARRTEASAWVSRGLAQRALTRGESLLCQDIRQEARNGEFPIASEGSLSSIICVQLRSPRRILGVLHLDRGAGQSPFTQEDLKLADALAASVATVIESVSHLLGRERELLVRTLTALAQAVDLRDDYTGSHTQRVTDYSLMLAEELGLSRAARFDLQIGTPLHDIGKIGISDYILRKPGPLTVEEAEYMKTHTLKGAAIIEIIPHLHTVVPIVRNHHERWDGLGYPDGLAGEEIPQVARIVGVADAFDAMTTDRPYRRSLTLDRAFAQIHEKAGAQFDPECVDALMRLRTRLEEHMLQARQVVETLTPSELVRQVAGSTVTHSSRCRTISIPKSALVAELNKKLASA